MYLADTWHNESYLLAPGNGDEDIRGISSIVTRTWRLKERMKTAGVALVVCLNIGILFTIYLSITIHDLVLKLILY